MTRLLLLVCFVVSGAAGLTFETVWSQQFALVFGSAQPALSCVLAAYLTGLALGARASARWAPRTRSPLLVFAAIEASVALTSLGVPFATQQISRWQPWFAAADGGLIAYQFGASFLVLLIPTGLMGATLPLLVRYAVGAEPGVMRHVGAFYAANTLGGAVGTLAAAFVLVPATGLAGTARAAAAAEIGVALAAGAIGLASRRSRLAAIEPAGEGSGPAWPFWVAGASGAVALGSEIVWSRLLSHLLGSSVYSIAAMLAPVLVGIAVGSALAARVADSPATAQRALAVTQLAGAVSFTIAFLLVDHVPSWMSAFAGENWLAAAFGCAAALILPGAACQGAAFPLAVRATTLRAADAAWASGCVLAWNTAGAVVGSVGVGLFVLPRLGLAGTLRSGAAAGLLLALFAGAAMRPRFGGCMAAALAGLIALAVWPLPTPWHLLRTSPLAVMKHADPAGPSTAAAAEGIEFYAVGRSSTVLLEEVAEEWRLSTDGLPESIIQRPGARAGRYPVGRWLALLPDAVRAGVHRMLVVGLGGGATVEDLPASLQSVHVVELEPAVVSANRAVAATRRSDPLRDPRVQVHLADVRSFLGAGEDRFDAIVSQPSHPWTAGSSHLFTSEFFERVRQRLRPGGVFVQWMGLEFVDEALFRTLLRTLGSVFRHVEVFEPHPRVAVLFVASDAALDGLNRTRFSVAGAAASWQALGVHAPEDVVLTRLLDAEGVRDLASGGALNRDDHNLLQARSPLAVRNPLGGPGLDRLTAALDCIRRLPPDADALYVVRRLLELRQPVRALRSALGIQDPLTRQVALAVASPASRRLESLSALFAERGLPAAAAAHLGAALMLAQRPTLVSGRGPADLRAWIEREPVAALVMDGWRRQARGDGGAALVPLAPALAEVPPAHPLWRAATRLRIAAEVAAGTREGARTALELLDAVLADTRDTSDLLLRARLGQRLGDGSVVLASLAELLQTSQSGLSNRTARTIGEFLDRLPQSGVLAGRKLRLARLLHQHASATPVPGEPTPGAGGELEAP